MKFDVRKWEENCDFYQRNAIGMKAVVKVKVCDGRLTESVETIDPKYEGYKKELLDVVSIIIKGAMCIMHQAFYPKYVSDEDFETEKQKTDAVFSNNAEALLNTLLAAGREQFIADLYSISSLCDITYQLSHIRYNAGSWTRLNGDSWEGGIWHTNKGEAYSDLLGATMTVLVGDK